MKKQMIEIEVPDGKKAVWKDGRVVFEDIKPQLPNTWEEFCKNYPVKSGEFMIDSLSKILTPGLRDREMHVDQNLLPSYKAAEQHLALMKLHQLRDCYRNGWLPNVKDDADKYCIERLCNPVSRNIELRVAWYDTVCTFLSFPTFELANEFLTNFRELIEEAGDLI